MSVHQQEVSVLQQMHTAILNMQNECPYYTGTLDINCSDDKYFFMSGQCVSTQYHPGTKLNHEVIKFLDDDKNKVFTLYDVENFSVRTQGGFEILAQTKNKIKIIIKI